MRKVRDVALQGRASCSVARGVPVVAGWLAGGARLDLGLCVHRIARVTVPTLA